MRSRSISSRTRLLATLALIAFTMLACNLSSTPPTPTLAPVPTSDPFLQAFPTSDPAGSQFFAPTATFITSTGATVGSDPNCPMPVGWITYTVEVGDSLSLLASQTNSTVETLAQNNCITDVDSLYTGQVIYLPSAPVIAP
jgi:hypothetical protein